jgi:Kef-type K+ transport system membrane component KefB
MSLDLLHEVQYVALLFGLFVVPRLLQRFRLPSAITSLALGALCGLWLGRFVGDPTVKLLSTFGIVSLFLFAVLQSTTWVKLGISAAILLAMVAALPLIFRGFAALVVPHAPKSEFAFLIMVAVICAVTTLKLGVYYLVGAFVVGVAAQRFREELPAMASERMLHAVETFASIFVPFYFFEAGLSLGREVFSPRSLIAGALFLALLIPLQLAVTALHRRWTLGENLRDSLRVSVSMLPTLVFTLVIAGILRERFDIAPHIFGGLMVYTLGSTLIPGFWLRVPPPEFDTPEVLPASQP